ncbi:MAG TPA: iron-sulfur cluster assembly protein IscA, partial [Gammaproteobacteria bacterium]|nr:iron-sulfur cluster assembly protein IscA [Gammaproteobacteria bacterium]
MSISLTDSAATRVRTYLEKRGHGVGLRVGVRKSGCNGWAYTID